MGGYLSAGEQSLTASLQEEYQMESHPYLLHRRTNDLCTLHKITTNSPTEAARVTQTVEEYARTRCEAISRLRAHYHLDRTGYCSDEQNFYLIFQGQNNYSLREEVGRRRFYQTPFREPEIQQVVETYLCGLKEYNHRFQRDYERLSLDSLNIDEQTSRIRLKDPWLGGAAEEKEHADSMTQLLLTYPSPEKLSSAFSSHQQDYSEFHANLFSVGVIALELHRLDFADTIYLRKKEVNYDEVRNRIKDFRDQKLRRGLECLLDANPNERKKIFQIWGIENREEHFLTPIRAGEREMGAKEAKDGKEVKEISKEYKDSGVKPTLDLADTRKKYTASTHNIHTLPMPPTWQPPRQTDSLWTHTHPTISFNKERPPANLYRPDSTKISMQYSEMQPQRVDFSEQKPLITIASINNSNSNRNLPLPRGPLNFRDFLPAETYEHKVIYNHQPINNSEHRIHFETPNFNKPITFNAPPPMPISNPLPNPIPVYQPLQQSRPAMPISTLPKAPPPASPIIGTYKQSFTFIDNFSNRVSAQNIRIESQVTHPDSPSKTKSDDHEKRQTNLQKLTESKQQASESPIIRPAADRTEAMVAQLKSEQQQEKADTPKRPTTKNKYNSTIVEVRDEDSPDHSCKSEEPLEEEYVVEEYETGSRYEGFKSLGMRNGRGKFYYQDGGYYEGQWRNNKMDGFGRLYYEGGKLAYEGSWSQDEFNGFGKVYNDNPIKLGEPFDYSNFDLLDDYWEYYEGMLMKDTKQGRGKIRLSNGELFEGDFHVDRIQGFGKFHTLGGQVVEGIWRESKLIKIINQ